MREVVALALMLTVAVLALGLGGYALATSRRPMYAGAVLVAAGLALCWLAWSFWEATS